MGKVREHERIVSLAQDVVDSSLIIQKIDVLKHLLHV